MKMSRIPVIVFGLELVIAFLFATDLSAESALRIEKAVCGAKDSMRDITAFLQSKVQGDTLSTKISQPFEEIGGDPAPGQAKYLIVEYQSNGVSFRLLLKEQYPVAFTVELPSSDAVALGVDSPSNQLATIRLEHAEAEINYNEKLRALPDTPEGSENAGTLWKEFDEKQADLFMKALELAKANPNSQVGFAALEWILQEPRAYFLPAGAPAMELMAEQYADEPEIGEVIANLAYYIPHKKAASRQPALELIRAVAKNNTNRVAQGQALLGLAWVAKEDFDEADYQGSPETEQFAKTAEKAFERIAEDYGSCASLRSKGIRPARPTLGEEAKSELFELRQLRVGHPAPEIEGEDLAGEKFKLSDYRGKVVLLVFWASWCGPCMGDVPHENELVERFKDRPFALIGVNGDGSRESGAQTKAENHIPWRSFWNSPRGPISDAWNVKGWPTTYVLDENGIIRYRHLRGDSLDEPLESLVNAAAAGATSSKLQ